MDRKRGFFAIGYGLAALWALIQFFLLFSKIRTFLYSGLAFYGVVAVMCGLCAMNLARKKRGTEVFVGRWNWIFLLLSLLAVWLGPSPETRVPNLWLLGFATLATATF